MNWCPGPQQGSSRRIIDRWNAGRAERIKAERAAEAVKEAPVKRRKKKKK